MSAPKTYAKYVAKTTARGESPLSREEWKKRKHARSQRAIQAADREVGELEILAEHGDSCAMAELDEIDR